MFGRLRNRLLLRWLAARIPGHRRHTLNMQSVFIMPTRFGVYFFVLCAALFILGTNYQNNLLLLLCYFFLSVSLVTIFTSYQNFARLQIQARGVNTVYAGDEALFQIQLSSHSHQQPAGQLTIRWWGHKHGIVVDLEDDDETVHLPRATYRRGVFPLPRVTFSSLYPLGLFRCWTHLDFAQPMTVFPRLEPASVHSVSYQQSIGNGTTLSSGQEDFDSLRTYRQGDPIARIAWKSVARGAAPAVKTFSEPAHVDTRLLVNPVSQTLEKDISQTAYLVVELTRRQQPFALQIGPHTYPAATGRTHRDKCLRALSTIGTQV